MQFVSRMLGWIARLEEGASVVDRDHSPPRGNAGGGDTGGEPSMMAWATLILGVASWVPLPVVAAIAGAIIGWMELGRIERGESPEAGETITRVGFWLSVANLVATVVFASLGVLLWVAFGVAILSIIGMG